MSSSLLFHWSAWCMRASQRSPSLATSVRMPLLKFCGSEDVDDDDEEPLSAQPLAPLAEGERERRDCMEMCTYAHIQYVYINAKLLLDCGILYYAVEMFCDQITLLPGQIW